MVKCKQCGKDIEVVPGKVQRQFCSDAHRKAYKRAELSKSKATASPSVDELRTDGTKLSTSDSLTADKSTPDSNPGQGVTDAERDKAIEFMAKTAGEAERVEPEVMVEIDNDGNITPVRTAKSKRGKDIKTFADLPPDVQQTIDSLSMVDGKICQRVKANRTAIAIKYQKANSELKAGNYEAYNVEVAKVQE